MNGQGDWGKKGFIDFGWVRSERSVQSLPSENEYRRAELVQTWPFS